MTTNKFDNGGAPVYKHAIMGPGFNIITGSALPFDEYINYIQIKLEKNELIVFTPVETPDNVIFFRPGNEQHLQFVIMSEKAYNEYRRELQYNAVQQQRVIKQ